MSTPILAEIVRTDGRRNRKRRNRALILQAARDLIIDGHWNVTMVEIANHTDLSVRALFEHFGSRGGLMKAMLEMHRFEIETLYDRMTDEHKLDTMLGIEP